MARKLSKKKITRLLLIIAAIVFLSNGGHRKLMSAFSNWYDKLAGKEAPKTEIRNIPVDSMLANRLDSFVNKTWRVGSLGIYVWDETAGKELYAFNPDSLMRPASNMKTLTTIAAIRRLGPKFKNESAAFISGKVVNGTLHGNLAFKFSYDPCFNTDSLRKLVSAVSGRGIQRIKGRIIADIDIKEPIQHEEHWTMGDLKTRKLGFLFRGEQRTKQELKYALAVQGISLGSSDIEVSTIPAGMKKISLTATPIAYSVFRALHNSSNEHAEALLYPLSGPYRQGQNFREAGTRYLEHFVEKELSIPLDSVCVIHDGSGLCVHNRLSPRFLVRMLHYAYAHKYIYNMLRAYLPSSGINGTLHDRMRKPEIRGRIQAKTGTLTREDGITSLAGYVTGSNGHQLIFSIIQNEVPVYDARIWQDKFCAELIKPTNKY